MSNATRPYRLLAPGPVPVPSEVLRQMNQKILHHRTPAFERILRETWSGLKTVFATEQPVLMIAGTGTAAMEAAVVNTLSPNDEALVVVSGKFGERWAHICERCGVNVHRMDVPWGKKLDLNAFTENLKSHPNLKVVFSQVCETSTATLHPIKEMARAVREQTNAVFAVDAITAVGCLPLPMDELSLDVVVGGSQKAFMIPTGLSFIALSEKAWQQQVKSQLPKYYLDLTAERKANEKGETHFSTPTTLIQGLHTVLQQVEKRGGPEVLFKRCEVLANATREAAKTLGVEVFSDSPSPSVTALQMPKDVDSQKVREWIERERNITVMGGQDQLKGKVLRIGHMGDVQNEDMTEFFFALGEALTHFTKDQAWMERAQKAVSELTKNLQSAEPLFP